MAASEVCERNRIGVVVLGLLVVFAVTGARTVGAAGRIDPCTLVTKADAEEVFGAVAKASADPDYPGLAGSIYTLCAYAPGTGHALTPSISVGLYQKAVDSKIPWDPNGLWKAQSAGFLDPNQEFGAPEKVAGLGDEAYWQKGTATLYVFKKGVAYFDLTVRDAKDEPSLDTAKKLAAKVLARLP